MNNFILNTLDSHNSFKKIVDNISKNSSPVLATGVIDAVKTHLIASLLENHAKTSLVITSSELKAKEIVADLQFFIKNREILFYPAKDIIFYSADVRSIDITKTRFAALNSVLNGEKPIVVLSIEALFDRLTPRKNFEKSIITLNVGEEYNLSELAEKFIFLGYERVSTVEAPGQFSLRGGIIDLCTIIGSQAVRIEFFGDEVDSIRQLDLITQRSFDKLEEIKIFPMRELVYGDEELQQAITLIEEEFDKTHKNLEKKGLYEKASKLKSEILESCERLKTEKRVLGVEKFTKYFYENSETLVDYLDQNSFIYFDEPTRILGKAISSQEEFNESIKNRILKGYLLPNQMDMVFSYHDILQKTKRHFEFLLSAMTTNIKDFSPRDVVHFDVRSSGVFKDRLDLFCEDIKNLVAKNYKILILAGTKFKCEQLFNELNSQGVAANIVSDFFEASLSQTPIIAPGNIQKGFIYDDIKLAILSEGELFHEKKKRKFRRHKKGNKIGHFAELNVGDVIVHDTHGVGIFSGIENINTDGVRRDYLKISYANDETLYMATNQMDMVTKYIASDSRKPKLNRLGGVSWQKAKAKAKGQASILAEDLIKLYALREAKEGFIFGADTSWQAEFEENFPYQETDDQAAAIEDVKADMESAKVMDRLVLGDVGYGKTEVAIRAAFKAVQDNKQVAILVPTTILAQQHFNNFASRMRDYPITVELMSRFRTQKQIKETIKNLESGKVDIVIGTHRVLSKDVKFKDLGLIVIDEEQRFGVAHKEKLKNLRENVDVLTLSATPIPRTLHLSLTGIRDMSIINEPPSERLPVQTFVLEYNEQFVRDAIMREISRGGQVYYLHNRVRSISDVSTRIQNLVPEANVGYAHGQMSETELENIMMDFISTEINVLVCTTIIESGLDISNANTIIIHDADNMGLSQLYQLRGRVGRSNRIAYCYLLYRKDKIVNEIAEKRLQTIREFTEFGAGFKISMRDLELRGAGNLLGAEQHGHIDAVGYDMYTKLLDEAVRTLKGEEIFDRFETSIDIKISAYIPESFIDDEERKLEIYKKISHITGEEDYNEVWEEIEDRYGDLPLSVKNLLDISYLKATANKTGITSVMQKGNNIVCTFKNDANIDIERLMQIIKDSRSKILLTSGQNPYITFKNDDDVSGKILRSTNELLKKIIMKHF